MRGLLAGRMQSVASLVAEVAEASGRVPMHAMEWSGGLRAVGAGMEVPPSAGTNLDRAWQDGTDVARVASACAGMSILGYVREADLLVGDIAGYGQSCQWGRRSPWRCARCPPTASPPTISSRSFEHSMTARSLGPSYHYGFMRLSNLAWIGSAKRAAT